HAHAPCQLALLLSLIPLSLFFRLFSQSSFLFFLRFRRPPPSPLFPYTTLFRSHRRRLPREAGGPQRAQVGQVPQRHAVDVHRLRSEEHTSELQSLTNLVCRLLLEKKKKTPTVAEQ